MLLMLRWHCLLFVVVVCVLLPSKSSVLVRTNWLALEHHVFLPILYHAFFDIQPLF